MDEPPMIEVGGVGKAHGLRGEVVVHPTTDRPEVRFAPGSTVVRDGTSVGIATSRPHKGTWLVRFDDIGDRTAAEGLRGATLAAPPLEGDDDTETYWQHELVGMTVVGPDGEDLGDVTALVELPAAAGYDLLEVAHPDGRTWLLPDVDELVEVVLTEDGDELLMLLLPPDDLLEPGRAVEAAPDADGAGA